MELLTSLIFLSIGYVLGYLHGHRISLEQVAEEVKKRLVKDQTIKPGVIKRPTAAVLAERNMPEKQKQTLDAMRDTLKNIPELQQQQEFAKKYGIKD